MFSAHHEPAGSSLRSLLLAAGIAEAPGAAPVAGGGAGGACPEEVIFGCPACGGPARGVSAGELALEAQAVAGLAPAREAVGRMSAALRAGGFEPIAVFADRRRRCTLVAVLAVRAVRAV